LQGAYEDQAGVAGIDPGAPVLPDRRFVTGGDSSAVARHAISAQFDGREYRFARWGGPCRADPGALLAG
jgi:hypothetical protein